MKRQLLLPFLFLWLGLGFVAQAQQVPDRQSDSLALVALYNSTGGPGWSDTSWVFSTAMDDWGGVIIDGTSNRVVGLRLGGFGMVGDMSDSVAQLTALTSMEVSKNSLTGLPAGLGQIPNLDNLNCEGNRLTFDDLIPLNQANIGQFVYVSQDSIPPGIRISVLVGDQLSITGPVDSAPGTEYQWFRQSPTGGPVAVQQIPGTNPTYTVTQASAANAGNYFCQITNPNLDDLTLSSIETQVRIVVQGSGPRALGQVTVTYPASIPIGAPIRFRVDSIFLSWGAIKDSCRCDGEIFMWDLPDTIRDGDLIIIGPEEAEGHSGRTVAANTDDNIQVDRNYPINLGLNAPGADQYTFDPSGFPFNTANVPQKTLVAIIDLGVDSSHLDIRPFLWQNPSPGGPSDICLPGDVHGYNFSDDNSNAFIDLVSHGTHISGLITGLLPNVPIELMSLKVGDTTSTIFHVACAMSYATQKGANVINLSMGYQGEKSSMLTKVFKDAFDNDVVVVTSAGNEGDDNGLATSLHWPSNYSDTFSNVLAVASVTPAGDELSSFSNFSTSTVNIGAPGENIISSMAGGGYGIKSGTSISNGFVTVLAAGYRAYSPAVDASTVVNIMRSNEFSTGETNLLTSIKDGRRVKFNLVNCAENPVARKDSIDMAEGSNSIEIDVLINDCYAAGILPVVEILPGSGTVSVDANGKIIYKPNNGFTGTDEFSYRLTANAGGSTAFDITTVKVVVLGGGCTWWQILCWILLGLLVIILLAWLLRNNLP